MSDYWLYIPNPENPMTDAMSPSPLILPDAAKGASKLLISQSVIKIQAATLLVLEFSLQA